MCQEQRPSDFFSVRSVSTVSESSEYSRFSCPLRPGEGGRKDGASSMVVETRLLERLCLC